MVITRFAPSPTGFLHIGGARTALFNYLFAKHHNGKFLLRIEDTDKARSTKEATEAIFSALKWLGLDFDGEVIFQSQRNILYKKAALQLLEEGKAYYCFTPQAEIDRQRNEAIKAKKHFIFNSPWRNAKADTYPQNIRPVIRFKAPKTGQTIIADTLQGDVVTQNSHLDDMVLLRSDGSATYMLAVVYDDHEMGITHIIRGDDHLNNAVRQIPLYQAFGWRVPVMTHIPLIHGTDGAKLSKRHGALGVQAYQDMGYLPEALGNYLLRLGWSHNDDEIISREQAIKWFNLDGLGKSPARLDFAKLDNLNAHYLRKADERLLTNMICDILQKNYKLTEQETNYINQGINNLKLRAVNLVELAELAKIYLTEHPISYSAEAEELIDNCQENLIEQVIYELNNLEDFTKDSIYNKCKDFVKNNNISLKDLMPLIRALITGMTSSPSIFEIIAIIGKENTINRLKYHRKSEL